jgi:hypothetical protein
MKSTIITRKALYELLWSETMSSIIKNYRITYTELKKICNEMSIPVPENGYWSKLKFVKEISKPALSVNYTGKDEIELFERLIPENPLNCSNTGLGAQDDIEEKAMNIFKVPEKLTHPDVLITNTKNYLDAVRKYDWRSSASYPKRIDVLNVNVSHEILPRALRIMDTIIKLLRAKDYDVLTKNDKTFVLIGKEEIEIRLKEKNRVSEAKDRYGSRQLVPTGKLGFIIGDYQTKEINDGQDLLETKLEIILSKLEAESLRKKEERIAAEERHRKWEEEKRIEREHKERLEKEVKSFKLLFLQASRMHQTSILRNYVQVLEDNAFKEDKLTDELKDWLDWAKKKIDWYDPLINKEDQLLNDEHKTNIFKDFIMEWQ